MRQVKFFSSALRAPPPAKLREGENTALHHCVGGAVRRTEGALTIAPALILSAIALGLVPLIFFAWQRGGTIFPDAYAWRVLRFTLLQASLSTMFSVLPAIFVARGFARQHFWGRSALLALFAVPLSLPVIVAIFGLTALYGNAGLLGGNVNLYGLGGIVLAHVFFNLPLAVRLLLQCLETTAPENHRLAAQLDFPDAVVFRHVDWPALKTTLPRVAALVFLLCSSSFVIVLLFGGPKATTLEVAIFQSLRMDFDVSRALTLTTLQIALSAVLVWAAAKALAAPSADVTERNVQERFDGKTPVSRIIDTVTITSATLLVVPVLCSIFVQGITHVEMQWQLAQALLTSLGLAVLTCCIAVPLAWGMAQAQLRWWRGHGLLTGLSLAGFIVPPAVISTGWFLAFRSFDGGLALAIALIAMMNSLMALPFIMTVLAPAMERAAQQHDRLCAQLDIAGWNRFLRLDMPALRGPLAQTVLMTFVLSLGDLTALTLLGSQGLMTLPALVQQQMGHYQSNAAGGTALILAVLCLLATLLAQRFSKWT
jgi:thiamine transport system permease protein